MTKNAHQKFKESILDLIFPRFCCGCNKEGSWLCDDCRSKITLIQMPTCIRCHRLNLSGICPNCRRLLPLTGVAVAGYYADPILREAIHAYKYEGVKELAPILGDLLLSQIQNISWLKNAVLLPIPLHRARQNSRGFNQAELLANYLAPHLALPIQNKALIRAKSTKPQVDLAPDKRLINIAGAFVVKNNNLIAGKNIILVDDVITTGATIGECAKSLKAGGAKRIFALAIARG